MEGDNIMSLRQVSMDPKKSATDSMIYASVFTTNVNVSFTWVRNFMKSVSVSMVTVFQWQVLITCVNDVITGVNICVSVVDAFMTGVNVFIRVQFLNHQ